MGQIAYQDEDAIREVVRKFERCQYAAEEFTHVRHLTVACWYLCTLPEKEALDRMREGLLRFTAHHGKHGYHETITRFWIELLADHLGHMPAGMSLTDKTNNALEHHGNKEVLFSFYSRERVMSERARRAWVEPDRRRWTQQRNCTSLEGEDGSAGKRIPTGTQPTPSTAPCACQESIFPQVSKHANRFEPKIRGASCQVC